MTPRQIYALEWAVEIAENWREYLASDGGLAVRDRKVENARAALRQAWHECRERQAAARIKPCRRAL